MPSTLILDELTAAAVYKDVQPVIVITKADLATINSTSRLATGGRIKTFLRGRISSSGDGARWPQEITDDNGNTWWVDVEQRDGHVYRLDTCEMLW